MLQDLIEFLESQPADKVVRFGFGSPMSYRGYYEDLAFDPAENVTIGSMLAHAKSALGQTFQGYKGGDYTMHEYTDCWIAEYGRSGGDKIGPTLMKYWASEPA